MSDSPCTCKLRFGTKFFENRTAHYASQSYGANAECIYALQHLGLV